MVSLTRRSTSSPVRCGMSQSSTASAGLTLWISSQARAPSGAVTVRWPAFSSTRETSSRPTASSSATTMGANRVLILGAQPPREAGPEETARSEAEPNGSCGGASLRVVDHDGDAAIARIQRIVGNARPAVGVAAHGVHLVWPQPALGHGAPRGVGAVGRQLPVAVAAAPLEGASVGVPLDGDPVRNLAELARDHAQEQLGVVVQRRAPHL